MSDLSLRCEQEKVYNTGMVRQKQILLFQSMMTDDRYRGIQQYAREHDWALFIESDATRPPTGWRGNGVLAALEDSAPVRRFMRELRGRGIPVVDLAEHYLHSTPARVTIDNREIGRTAMRHFSVRGFRSVAFFSREWSRVHALRYAGLCEADRAAVAGRKWIWQQGARGQRNDMPAFSQWLTGRLVRAENPLGLFCYNDLDAHCAINVCLSCGISVPDDVAVLGVDDNPLICETAVIPISSVRHAFFKIGYEGARMLDELMSGNRLAARTRRLPPGEVMERASTNAFGSSDPLLKKALVFMAGNLSRSIGSAEIAEGIGVTRAQLYACFAANHSCQVNAELMRQRMTAAKALLRSGNQAIADIAAKVGFCNASYFIATFRRRTGLTPLAYRKVHGKST